MTVKFYGSDEEGDIDEAIATIYDFLESSEPTVEVLRALRVVVKEFYNDEEHPVIGDIDTLLEISVE